MNTYKVTLYFSGNEDDAEALQKMLAQAVSDEFDIGAVYGVEIAPDKPETGSAPVVQAPNANDNQVFPITYEQSMYDKLSLHLDHEIEMVAYGGDWNISIECLDCCEVLFSAENHNRGKGPN